MSRHPGQHSAHPQAGKVPAAPAVGAPPLPPDCQRVYRRRLSIGIVRDRLEAAEEQVTMDISSWGHLCHLLLPEVFGKDGEPIAQERLRGLPGTAQRLEELTNRAAKGQRLFRRDEQQKTAQVPIELGCFPPPQDHDGENKNGYIAPRCHVDSATNKDVPVDMAYHELTGDNRHPLPECGEQWFRTRGGAESGCRRVHDHGPTGRTNGAPTGHGGNGRGCAYPPSTVELESTPPAPDATPVEATPTPAPTPAPTPPPAKKRKRQQRVKPAPRPPVEPAPPAIIPAGAHPVPVEAAPLTGQTFNRLRVLGPLGAKGWRALVCRCECTCGAEYDVMADHLVRNVFIECPACSAARRVRREARERAGQG